MPHIHELIDFTVGVFIVKDAKVLLVHHKKLNAWVCPGGHIELDEDPEIAAHREIKEETGLQIKILGNRPPTVHQHARPLISPRFMDIHDFNETHQHIGMYYFAQPVSGEVILEASAHFDIRWFSKNEVDELSPMTPSMKWFAKKAIEEVSWVKEYMQ